jgi:hypothetical protein
MKELFTNIKTLFEYFNGGVYVSFIVFIISVIYIWIVEKNKKVRDIFTWYTVIILLVIWNPLAIYILKKFINFSSMYRVYYMLPLYPTIAFAFTKFIERRKSKKIKIISLVCILVFVCFLNEQNIFLSSVYQTYNYNNLYKLPDETIAVANIIYNDDTYSQKKAIVPYGMSSQIQQIYPSINLLYTRIVSNTVDENGNPSPTDSDDPTGYEPIQKINEGDTAYIANLCKEQNINYVALEKNLELQEPMENYGFEVLNKTDEHIVYVKVN